MIINNLTISLVFITFWNRPKKFNLVHCVDGFSPREAHWGWAINSMHDVQSTVITTPRSHMVLLPTDGVWWIKPIQDLTENSCSGECLFLAMATPLGSKIVHWNPQAQLLFIFSSWSGLYQSNLTINSLPLSRWGGSLRMPDRFETRPWYQLQTIVVMW